MQSNLQDRKLLVVDDDLESVAIVTEVLKWDGFQVEHSLTGEPALKKAKEFKPDLVLLDATLPDPLAVDTLIRLREREDYISVVFISNDSSTQSVIAGLDAGADDFIPKPFDPLELLARVRNHLRIKDLNDQLRIANERLKELVDIDDLTGLFNMRSVYDRIEAEIQRSKRFNRPVCVVMMDMDNFKSVNDGHDHLFGSYVLSEVGKVIKSSIRSIDLAARYGGDEFLILLTETPMEGAQLFCERLRNTIRNTVFKSGEDEIRLTASIGFAITMPTHSQIDARNLVRSADHALYDAKKSGRNRVCHLEIGPADRSKKQSA